MPGSEMNLSLVLGGADILRGDPEAPISVTGLAWDSRSISPGDLFFAISGFRMDGHDFLPQAQAAGAVAAVTSKWIAGAGIPLLMVADVRRTMAVAAANFQGHPSAGLTVVGVTGTNGKTTTTFMIDAILKSSGAHAALFGGIEYRIGERSRHAVRTTPEAPQLQALLAEAKAAGADTVAMEVSSHGIELHRTDCIDFDVAVFTNLSHDHLDLHHDMESYFQTKRSLFTGRKRCGARNGGQMEPLAVINADDAYGSRLADELSDAGVRDVCRYGTSDGVRVQARDIEYSDWETAYTLASPEGEVRLELRMPGEFNLYNSLAAASVAASLAVPLEKIKKGLESFPGVAGRFERVDVDSPFAIIIDYAHNQDGLRQAVAAARRITSGKLIVVFGCPGERDREKRPVMGKIAGESADLSILTTDDCYREPPEEILDAVEAGLREAGGRYMRIRDRRSAIKAAIEEAAQGDTVLIAGKGHEEVQIMADGPLPFSDRGVVFELVSGSGSSD